MTRLINADEMVKSLMDMTFYDEEGYTIDDYEDRLAIVKSFVNSVPTVEAQPVRHGKWKKIKGAINCSACKSCSWSTSFEGLVSSFNYCPNCGANMGEDDGTD